MGYGLELGLGYLNNLLFTVTVGCSECKSMSIYRRSDR